MNTPDPKQKALELVEKFKRYTYTVEHPDNYTTNLLWIHKSKQCAIIAVKREIETLERLRDNLMNMFMNKSASRVEIEINETKSVLTEINKM